MATYIYTTGRTAFKLIPYYSEFPGSQTELSFSAFLYVLSLVNSLRLATVLGATVQKYKKNSEPPSDSEIIYEIAIDYHAFRCHHIYVAERITLSGYHMRFALSRWQRYEKKGKTQNFLLFFLKSEGYSK